MQQTPTDNQPQAAGKTSGELQTNLPAENLPAEEMKDIEEEPDSKQEKSAEESQDEENKDEENKDEEDKDEEDKDDENKDEEDKGEEDKGEGEDLEEAQESTSKKYTKEEDYAIIALSVRYPSGGHGGEAFWNWMVKMYGESLLEGRNASGLRNRWRKMLKMYPSGLEEYRKQLVESLPKEFVDEVEKKIAEAAVDVAKFGLSSKAYTSLFPELPKPVNPKDAEKGIKKKKLDDGSAQVAPGEEEKKVKKSKDLLRKAKNYIDLNPLASKKTIDISQLSEDNMPEIQSKIAHSRSIVIVKDIKDNNITVKDLKEMASTEEINACKKVDSNLDNFFKSWNQAISKSNKEKGPGEWTELEDLVLKHPEYSDMINYIVKTHGAEEVDKHKKALNLM